MLYGEQVGSKTHLSLLSILHPSTIASVGTRDVVPVARKSCDQDEDGTYDQQEKSGEDEVSRVVV